MPTETSDVDPAVPSRRLVLRGAAVTGLGVPLLVACGSDGETPGTAPGSSATSGEAGGGGGSLASTAEVPVGGGKILPDEQIVVTQPTEGEFKAFTAVCTHQQCVVSSVSDGSINCECHGSRFSVEDGSPQGGPAPSPLDEVEITVKNNKISLA